MGSDHIYTSDCVSEEYRAYQFYLPEGIQGRIQGLEKGGGSNVMYKAPKARNEA